MKRALLALVIVTLGVASQADAATSVSTRAKLLRLEQKARADFEKAQPGALPEARLERPRSTARAFDWTEFGIATQVRSQGKTKTCWAHVGIDALEASWTMRNGTNHKLAVQPVLDTTGHADGAGPTKVFDALLLDGTTRERDYPFQGKSRAARNVELRYRAVAWDFVAPRGQKASVQQLKAALLKHGPLYVSVFSTRKFKKYRSGVYREAGKFADTNHAVLLVGWDDAKKAWKIKNSWSTHWGEKGFMWIAYGSNNIGANAAWVRAQSTYYRPPADFPQLVPDAQPLPRWAPPGTNTRAVR